MSGRDLTSAVAAQVEARDTAPGYFVELQFPVQTIRLCSRGTLTWAGETWLGWGFEISGLKQDEAGDMSGQIRFNDFDDTVRAAFFADDVRGCPVRIWKIYGNAPAASDPALLFDGMADAPSSAPPRVQVELLGDRLGGQWLPRGSIAPAAGCTHQTAPGVTISWGAERITLEALDG